MADVVEDDVPNRENAVQLMVPPLPRQGDLVLPE
jgi:hypothetical protein